MGSRLIPASIDKRLMVIEPEFAGVLAVVERHGNTLSPLMRKAWDGGILSTMTRNAPLRATGAHISIVGHITVDELRARLTRTDTANGFANRFLFMLVKRSTVLLPFGGDALEDTVIAALGGRLKEAVEAAASIGRVGWTNSAANAWKTVYPQLSRGQPGLLGAVTSRAEAQCVRLALIYALLDGAANIDLPHIKAALAVWEYAEASAAHIFGASLGDPVADDIYRALRHAGREGMSRTAHPRPVRRAISPPTGSAPPWRSWRPRAGRRWRSDSQAVGPRSAGSRRRRVAMGKYLDILDRAGLYDISDQSDKSPPFGRLNRFCRTFSALETRCPELVPVDRWQAAVEDGRRFLARWGEQAEALGWTARTCSASTSRRRRRTRATAACLATTRPD